MCADLAALPLSACVCARACLCLRACMPACCARVCVCVCVCVYGGFRDAQAKVELQERLQALREKGSAQVAADWGGVGWGGVGSGRVGLWIVG